MPIPPSHTIRLQTVDKMLQLFPTRVRALEHRISRVVGELYRVHEVCVEAECLEGKYGGAVAHASWRDA
jgi:hypothetical protein